MTTQVFIHSAIDHRAIVSRVFKAWGLAIGLVAVPTAVGCAVMALKVGLGAPKHASQFLDVGRYGVAGLLSNVATGVGGVLC